jgi:hypothetical protein
MSGTAGHGWRSNGPVQVRSGSVRRGTRRFRVVVAGGWRRARQTGGLRWLGVLLPTDPAVQQHVLALFGPLLMVTCWPEPDDGGRPC